MDRATARPSPGRMPRTTVPTTAANATAKSSRWRRYRRRNARTGMSRTTDRMVTAASVAIGRAWGRALAAGRQRAEMAAVRAPARLVRAPAPALIAEQEKLDDTAKPPERAAGTRG